MSYSKRSVTFHADGFGPGRPAVNVKIHQSVWDERNLHNCEDPEFTLEWVQIHMSGDDVDGWFWIACRDGIRYAEEDAQEIFGDHVKVYTEGRSDGWLVVEGIDDFEDWNAAYLAKWRRFEKVCETYTRHVPSETFRLIELNVFAPWKEARDADAALDAAAQLPIQATQET